MEVRYVSVPLLIDRRRALASDVVPEDSALAPRCYTTGGPANGVSGYSPEQTANAATIVAVGKRMQIPEHGLVTAVAAAL